MKYIDAEKLIAEIERRIKSYRDKYEISNNLALENHYASSIGELESLLSFIESLEKEQEQDVDLDKEIDVFFYGETFKRCFDGVRIPGVLMRDWQNPNVSKSLNADEIRRFARHFYNLGLNAKSDAPKIKGWVARDGVLHRSDIGVLRFFDNKPFRRDNVTTINGEWGEHSDYPCKYIIKLPKDLFPDLKWEDEPIEVELIINRV